MPLDPKPLNPTPKPPGVEGGDRDVATDIQPPQDPSQSEPEYDGGMISEGGAAPPPGEGRRDGGMIGEG
jgi:hypothetical protein